MEKKKKVLFPELMAELARNGENQKTLAELLGMDSAMISRRLSGEVQFTLKDIETICKHFKKDYYELFGKK